MQTKKWNEVRSGSKITLKKTQTIKGMNGEPQKIEAGSYFITGFWADICGLNKTDANGSNEVCIQSRELIKFNNITT